MMYLCQLVKDGFVKERFWKEGKSAKAVQEGLDMFDFGPGEWEIIAESDTENNGGEE